MKAEDNSLLPSNNFEIGIRAGAVFFSGCDVLSVVNRVQFS